MMEVDEDSRDNMEVDEEGYDSVPTVRGQIQSNNDLNLLPVDTVNTVQQPIREQLPVERRPQLPPPTEQQQHGMALSCMVQLPLTLSILVLNQHSTLLMSTQHITVAHKRSTCYYTPFLNDHASPT
ncbi:hypothetical protein PsorP6_009827 [Peronosclerospora sorghi]|uniref:Uncharacterized protein n=1 Tax=Peronosclerospora sorghi TaxID=230839 RepID=A0ACC0W2X7_9STRA|nr:hypothetical protein PsorP6_009827 [Peronosclerospora sorghi]